MGRVHKSNIDLRDRPLLERKRNSFGNCSGARRERLCTWSTSRVARNYSARFATTTWRGLSRSKQAPNTPPKRRPWSRSRTASTAKRSDARIFSNARRRLYFAKHPCTKFSTGGMPTGRNSAVKSGSGRIHVKQHPRLPRAVQPSSACQQARPVPPNRASREQLSE